VHSFCLNQFADEKCSNGAILIILEKNDEFRLLPLNLVFTNENCRFDGKFGVGPLSKLSMRGVLTANMRHPVYSDVSKHGAGTSVKIEVALYSNDRLHIFGILL